MRKAILFSLILSFLFAATIGHAVIPEYITLQGRLSDTNNNPLNGLYDFDLEIYDSASGGTSIWSETQSNVNVTNGIFNILLGNVQTLDDAFDDEYWIEISVESSTLSPRVRMTSSPYAYYAENAGGASSDIYVNETGDTMTGSLDITGAQNLLNITQGFEGFTYAVNIDGSTRMESNGVYNTLSVNQSKANMYSGYFNGGKGIYVGGNLNMTGNIKAAEIEGTTLNASTKVWTPEVETTKITVNEIDAKSNGTIWAICNTTDCSGIIGGIGPGGASGNKSRGIYGYSGWPNGYAGYFIGGKGVHIKGNLNVTGNIYYDGSLNNYHIYESEITLVNNNVEENDVLIISKDYDSSAEISSEEYDTKVFGVALEDTSIGEEVGVVILGRFPVKVTTENGPIERGDMLTTSSLSGYAMKCNDKIKCIGAVIGKALEPLESGTGKINVMVSPQ